MESIDHRKLDERRAFVDHVRQVRDITLDELARMFSLPDALVIDEFQTDIGAAGMVEAPLPRSFMEERPEDAIVLIGNSGFYSEDIEDTLYEDPLLNELVEKRDKLSRENEQKYMEAVRARRSVLVIKLMGSRS